MHWTILKKGREVCWGLSWKNNLTPLVVVLFEKFIFYICKLFLTNRIANDIDGHKDQEKCEPPIDENARCKTKDSKYFP
jgi:hypothetical protein